MKTDSNNEEFASSYLTRRKVLAMAGATGVALMQFQSASRAQHVQPVEAEVSRTFSSVSAMQKARGLNAGMLVRTLGYHTPQDGGGAYYLIARVENKEAANGGHVIGLKPGLQARLLEARSINYRMFGALSDGKNDDGVQIKLAHEYANRHRIPVVNETGEFWIKQTSGIPITTSVQWGKSIFHIDEKFSSPSIPRFSVQNDQKRQSLTLDAATKAAIIAQLKPGVMVVPELAPYKNCLVQVLDANDKIGFRAGAEYKGQAWAREELFYVEEHGRIIGDIAWEFKDFTQVNVTPCSDHYLIIEGGGFYLSGDVPGEKYTGYYHCGFSVERSRTIIRNQWMGLEKGNLDISMQARRGFYSLNHVYDVTLENIRLIPFVYDRGAPEKNVGAGTYGIGGGRMLNCTFRNVTAEGSGAHWGVFGTNVNKNFRIENCNLNRIDVHFHCWNLYIRDSTVGLRGISITGGGHLWIENTVLHGNQFINFRADFGAVWNGDIHIKNCRLMPVRNGGAAILRNVMSNWNYGYPVGAARSVKVEDFIIDYSAVPDAQAPCWLMEIAAFSKMNDGRRLFFPNHVSFRNVQVIGREQGVRLLQIPQPGSYDVGRNGGYDKVLLQPNSKLVFENIHLEKIAPAAPKSPAQVHLRLGGDAEVTYEDARALYPLIRFADCNNLAVSLGGAIAEVSFQRCTVNSLTASMGQPFKGRLSFDNCRFIPEVAFTAQAPEKGEPFYTLDAELGTSFTNCTLHAPLINGDVKPELFNRIGFVQLNTKVRYSHVNTMLGNDVLNYCQKEGIALSPSFIAMLKAHHALESETVATNPGAPNKL